MEDGDLAETTALGDDLGKMVHPDRYRLIRRLGSGSGGRVFLAEHLHLGEPCVVKILNAPPSVADPEAAQQARNEARVGFNVSHPNVARVLDCDCIDGVWYYVMEYVPGCDLAHIVDQYGLLCWRQVVEVGRSVAAGLMEIHRAGLLHRDLKPSNLLLCAENRVKITDLGLVTMMGNASDLEQDEPRVTGTLLYMAPEQLRGDRLIDARADCFAVGATLFHLLTGRPHRLDIDPLSLLSGRDVGQVEWPVQIRTETPGWVLNTIELCMAEDPDGRIRSADELVEALTYEDRIDRADLLSRHAPPEDRSMGVVVTPFENVGQDSADAWIGYAIAEHLDARLIELPGIRVVDSRRFATLIERRGTPAGQVPERTEALRAARDIGAEVVVYGRFQSAGQELWFNAYAVRPEGDKPQHLASRTGIADEMVSLFEGLADDVVRVLVAGSQPMRSGHSRRGTRSLMATQRYITGRRSLANGEYEEAIRLATEALEIDPEYVEPIGFLGACYSRLGQYDRALEFHHRHQFIARQQGDPYRMAEALSNIGVMYYYMEEHRLAIEFMERSASLERDLSLHSVLATNCNNMGYVLLRMDRPTEARVAFLRSIELNKGIGDLVSLISPYNGVGRAAQHEKRFDEAYEYYSRALTLADELGDRVNVGVSHFNLGRCACLSDRLDEGRHELELAVNILADSSDRYHLAIARQSLGDVLLTLGEFESAREHAEESIALAQRHQNRRLQVQGWELLARIRDRDQDRPAAMECLRQARAVAPESDKHLDLGVYLREICRESEAGEPIGRSSQP